MRSVDMFNFVPGIFYVSIFLNASKLNCIKNLVDLCLDHEQIYHKGIRVCVFCRKSYVLSPLFIYMYVSVHMHFVSVFR